MLGEMDSAAVYYRRGFTYLDGDNCGKKGAMFMQNYASFLISGRQYAEAERLLMESETAFSGSEHIYNVYSTFSTLYYETGEYDKALLFGKRMLGSRDSVMQCSAFLHLYRAYGKLGETDSVMYFHNLYRQYDSDITLRRKTAEGTAIPYQLANRKLQQANKVAHRWLWGWGIGLVVAVVVAIYIIGSSIFCI